MGGVTMKVHDIIEATGGLLLSGDLNTEVIGATQDSRQIKEGNLYIAIKGQKQDGHSFVLDALSKGAAAVLVEDAVDGKDKAVIQVSNTVHALQQLAHYVRTKNAITVIGITGSVGKTSTKDIVYNVVKQKYRTLKTKGNYNNEIGLPLTILQYQDEEVMVLEMGMDQLQQISVLSHIAKPDIAIITNVGSAHIGVLGNRDNILQAKLEIIEGMEDDGVLILNDDNDMLRQVQAARVPIVRVGSQGGDIVARNIKLYEDSSEFTIEIEEVEQSVSIPVPGQHFIINALLAIAAGRQLQIPLADCIKGIASFTLTKNRMDIFYLRDTIKVIDGTYNASEDSLRASIDVLTNQKGRKICIVGDILDMGSFSQKVHESLGKYIASKEIDILICKGEATMYTKVEAQNHGMEKVMHFSTNEQIVTYLEEILQSGDVILCKGSNALHMEGIINSLKEKWA